jgi:tellurite resistance protein TerC
MEALTDTPLSLWIGFTVLVAVVIAIDLGIGQRRAHAPSMKEAATWTMAWVSSALLFNYGIYRELGSQRALEFLTGYIIEYSLSVDNLFVFIMIFSFFGVAPDAQPRLLKWGILGAVILRAIFVALGAVLLHHFHWMIYVFGVFLVFTGVKMLQHSDEEVHPDKNPLVKLTCRLLPVHSHYDGAHFFTKVEGRRMATPLLVALVAVESTDVVFALDSIPAIYGITSDPFIVYTSNIFAIMGLRALFFLLAGAMALFRHLKTGVAAVLIFVGTKMAIDGFYHISIHVSLGVIFTILALSILISLRERPAASAP